jgi:hypothetical protein
VKPASTTRWPNSVTPGCNPGISWITITAGPDPARYTSRVVPSWTNVDRAKPGTSGVLTGVLTAAGS